MIGTHSGSYGVYRALAVAAGKLSRGHRADVSETAPADVSETAPADVIDPHPQWGHPSDERALLRPVGA
jgi:hypothetical protein